MININQPSHSVASPHKIPTSLWTLYEKARGSEDDKEATEAATETVTEELNTEGFNVASIMSYAMPEDSEEVVQDLPKPSDHESEVLVEKQVVSTEESGYSGFVPRRKTNKEKWRKSLLASKKKYNKPKFPRVPLLPFAPSHQKNQVLN